MKWRVMVELAGAEGTVQLHEVSVGGSTTAVYSAETLGLTVAEGKMTWPGCSAIWSRRRQRSIAGADVAASIVARNARSRTSVAGD